MAASTSDSFGSLLSKAQSTRINLDIFSDNLNLLINAHADAIGVPPEFILWPLLTAAASFMGTNALIKINEEWPEPAIIWLVVAARKGEKKTAALRHIRKPIEKIEEDLRSKWQSQDAEDRSVTPPQLIVDHFSFEELHTLMMKNDFKILGMFDELSCFYGLLDLYKHSSTVDRKTLLTLNGGGPWVRNFRSYSGHMDCNVTGFIQPTYIYDMLKKAPDADGLNDRQLFDFPPERELFQEELKVPMAANVPDLHDLFVTIIDEHNEKRVYTMEEETYTVYRGIHNDLVKEKMQASDENAQGILSVVMQHELPWLYMYLN